MSNTNSGKPLIGLHSAALIVVANMIGSAIFSVTGNMATQTPSHFALLLSWVIGGLMALAGALSYSELASRYPRSGGEYHFLSLIYHPSIGFVSGFVSLVVGFSAAIAANAYIFAIYTNQFLAFGISEQILAISLVTLLTVIHATNIHYGVAVQNIFALLKVGLIAFFILAGLFVPTEHPVSVNLIPSSSDWDQVFSKTFAVGMINVFYAYLGWNAAVYVTGEIKNARRNVPLALLIGTGTVTVLYLLINYVFLKTVPIEALQGEVKIGTLSAEAIFGSKIAQLLSFMIAFALVSSTSSMVMAGPRVTEAMGEDYPLFKWVVVRKGSGGPLVALGMQWAIAVSLILTSSFFQILSFIGFTLSLFSALTVAGVYVSRIKHGTPSEGVAKVIGYPFTPAIFILLSLWMVVNTVINDFTENAFPKVTLAGTLTLAAGFALYFFTKQQSGGRG